MSDNRMTGLIDGLRNVGNLHEFAELFGFDWHDDSDWTWSDVALKMADDFEQATAERTCTFVDGWCSECGLFHVNGIAYCPYCGAKVVSE